ncbi:MAG: hypothetical protein EBT13_01555 [Rhodobacteraceae bacterium]|nr:hypothetical protein [Paracoccaceae bacterium]
MAQGTIIAFRNDRLGGRLNAILTGMRLAERYGAPLTVFWPNHEDASIELQTPEDLFDADFMARCFVDKKTGIEAVRNGVDIGAVPADMTEQDFRRSLSAGTSYLSNSATEQLRLPWEGVDVLDDLPRLLREMPFTKRVREVIDLIDAKLGGVSFRSYHLRRGDIIDDAALASHNLWSNKYIPRVIYEWLMKRELSKDEEGMIVVFSDAQKEAEAFAAMSPRIRSFTDLVGDTDLKPLQRDFLELYTMSRSECIFAPPSSAFSGIAAAIGNSRVFDIEADLSDADRAEAMDELVERLEKRPEAFLSQSDNGQNFPFIMDHLEKQGQGRRAHSIIMGHVERGLDRAYVYPLLSEKLLADDDLDGCDRLVEILHDRPCYREEHSSTVFAHACAADLLRGNIDRAITRYHVGSWFYPINRLTSELFWYMSTLGHLTSDNTYPFDVGLMRKAGRILRVEDNPAFERLMEPVFAQGIQPRQYPSNMEVRDWKKLQGKKLNFSFVNRAKIERQIEQMGQHFRKDPDAAAYHSAVAALYTETGQKKQAEHHHLVALGKEPDMALYHKRYAEHLFEHERRPEGFQHLEAAVRLSDGNICYRAELANRALAAGDKATFSGIYAELRDQKTELIEVKYMVAEAMRRDQSTLAEVPAYLDDLLQVAPGAQRLLALKSKAYEQLELFDDALDIVRTLKSIGRQDSIIRSKVKGIYKAYRKANTEKLARAWCAENGITDDFTLL